MWCAVTWSAEIRARTAHTAKQNVGTLASPTPFASKVEISVQHTRGFQFNRQWLVTHTVRSASLHRTTRLMSRCSLHQSLHCQCTQHVHTVRSQLEFSPQVYTSGLQFNRQWLVTHTVCSVRLHRTLRLVSHCSLHQSLHCYSSSVHSSFTVCVHS